MASASGTKAPERAPTATLMSEAPPAPAFVAGELTVEELAQAILARELKPRVPDIRRLAEAVLASKAKGKKDKSGGKKARKLAKIPGQKLKKNKK